MPLGEIIKSLEEDGAYKYLGVLEADNIKHNKIKKEIIKEYVKPTATRYTQVPLTCTCL